MHRQTFWLSILLLPLFAAGQTAHIRFRVRPGTEKYAAERGFFDLKVSVNSQVIPFDTSSWASVALAKTDVLILSGMKNSGADTLLAHFRKGERYIIEFNTCSGTPEIHPAQGGKRGTVKFINRTSDSLLCIASDHNGVHLAPGQSSRHIEATESAMCYFKACTIAAYRGYTEPLPPPLTQTHFVFLHEEKVTAIFRDQKCVLKIR